MGLCAGSWISRSRPAAPPTLVKIYKAGAEAGAEAAAEARVSPRQKSWFRQLFECLEGGCGSARSQGGAPSSPLSTNSGLSPSEDDDASWTPTLLRSTSTRPICSNALARNLSDSDSSRTLHTLTRFASELDAHPTLARRVAFDGSLTFGSSRNLYDIARAPSESALSRMASQSL